MRFFATQFSTILSGLLIVGSFACANKHKLLTDNNIKEEEKMSLSRDEIPVKDRWNVEALYVNPESWKKELVALSGGGDGPKWPEMTSYKGRLGEPDAAASFLEGYLALQRKLDKLHTYAHLRLDEDVGNDFFKSDYGMISSLLHEFSLEVSWVEPELLSLNESEFHHLLSHQKLAPYRFHLEKIGRMRPHTLTPAQEELLALSGKALDTAYKTFGALNNADLSFKPAIDSKGNEHPLSNGTYLSYLRSPDRNLRKTAFENLHRGFESHANTLCELIQGQVQSHLFIARARNFSSCLESALFPHQVDLSVYENLIASVRARLPLMHEYVALRKKVLNLDEIHMYDLYVPLVSDAEAHMEYDEGRKAVIASVEPLGTKYQAALAKGLTEDRWVDAFENIRKRSGAYSSGCYDSMPYILMNYHGTLNDVLTLAHEAGHSMHSLLSRSNQPYIYAQYPIFVAEVASTFNEQLLLKHLKTKAKSRKDQAFLINYQIEGIRGTILRQTMFAEFELQLHKWAEAGVTLTPQLLKKHYLQLNRDYYGPDIVLDPELEIEWARIPHFYYNFYVYQYATGLSAALALFQKAMNDEGAKAAYLQFLSSGGSKYPIDLLKGAGVDMRSSDAVNAALDHFEHLLKELRSTL
jgi:oligoendopeptidase F